MMVFIACGSGNDWNCPQTLPQDIRWRILKQLFVPQRAYITKLEAEVKELKQKLNTK